MNESLIPLVLRAMCGPSSLPCGRCLRYGKGMAGFGAFVLSIALAIALAAGFQARPLRPSEVSAVESMVVAFGLVGALFLVEAFAIDHAYDDAGITYRSLWSRKRRVAWTEVERIEWRPIVKWLDLVPRGGGTALHISPMLGGLAPFAELALRQVPAYVLAAKPEAVAALHAMAAGRHAELLASRKRPAELMEELGLVGASRQTDTQET